MTAVGFQRYDPPDPLDESHWEEENGCYIAVTRDEVQCGHNSGVRSYICTQPKGHKTIYHRSIKIGVSQHRIHAAWQEGEDDFFAELGL